MAITDIKINEFRKLFDIAKDVANVGYWEWDIKTSEVLWSKQKIEIYGEDNDEFEPTFDKFLAVIDDETRARVFKEIEDVLGGNKEYYDLKHKINLKNGKTSWVHEKAFVIYSLQHEPLRMVGIVYDNTNKVLTLEKLKDSLEENTYTLTHDQLTGLGNKESLNKYITKLVEEKINFNLLFLDVDDFKTLNHVYSYIFGDIVLQNIAQNIKKIFTNIDETYRYGSDEFVIVIKGTLDIQEKLKELKKVISQTVILQSNKINLSVSIGISSFSKDCKTASECITNANSALKVAKSLGKNKVLFYEPFMIEDISKKHLLLKCLEQAIENEEIFPFYQPKIDSKNNKILGFEALARWNKKGEEISPYIFINLAIENGLINSIDYLILKQALKQLKIWHSNGYKITLSVNFTNGDFDNSSILELLQNYKEYLSFLTIEVLESELMHLNEDNLKSLEYLKSLGIRLSLDDFGTGYSSLQYLHKLPIDELKIDKSFVDRIPGTKKDEDLVKIIYSIVDTFDLQCIVEGIETEIQKNFFNKLGLFNIQGYLYSKPLSQEDSTKFLTSI